MVGMAYHRHAPKHARKRQEAGQHGHGGHLPELPERFWPLREHAEKVARGEWTNPELEDHIRALRREFDAWQRDRRSG